MTHGHSGYRLGCRCDDCVVGHRAYAREWRRHNYVPRTVDAAPYIAIVRAVWRQTRQPLCWIAGQAHVDVGTIRRLIDGHSERIWISTAAAVRSLIVWLPQGGEA